MSAGFDRPSRSFRNKINYNFVVSCLAWFDGAAIYLAVLIVSGFSAIVDYQKEKKFVQRSQVEEDENNGVVAAAVAGDIQKEEEGEDEDVVSKENKKNHLLESAIPWRPTGSNATSGGGLVREGDLVVVYERSDRMKAVRVKKGGVLQNRFGVFEHDSWIGALPFGSIAYAKQFSKDKTVEEKPAAETKVEEMEIEDDLGEEEV